MNDLALTAKQIKTETRTFWRNPSGSIFTIALPLFFLIITFATDSTKTVTVHGHTELFVNFAIPGIMAYGVFGASFNGLGTRICILRDSGALKRVRGTPVPKWIYLAGLFGTCIAVGLTLSTLLVVVSEIFYHLHFHFATLLGLLLGLIMGAGSICAVTIALTGFIPNADAAPGIFTFLFLPQLFLGEVFFPLNGKGFGWDLARDLPLTRMANAFQFAFNTQTKAPGIAGADIGVLALWIVFGSLLALKTFRWENKTVS